MDQRSLKGRPASGLARRLCGVGAVEPPGCRGFAFSSQVDDSVRRQLIDSALPQWSRIDPAAAAAWAVHLPEGSADGALERVVQEWSTSDPVATIDFLANTVEGKKLDEMTERAVKNWSHSDLPKPPRSSTIWSRER